MPPPPRPWEDSSLPAASSSAMTNTASDQISSPPPLPTSVTPSAQRVGMRGSSMGLAGYGSGMGGYGMGMGGYGMGMGMGGYGMGMGMGGYGMGMGMGGYGMGGYGMGMGASEVEQRGQIALMVIGRVVEMVHAFTNVMQMTVGSAMQFMGSFVGLSQQYKQLSTENESSAKSEVEAPTLSRVLVRLLKRLALFGAALYLASRIQKYFARPATIEAGFATGFEGLTVPTNSLHPSARGAHSAFSYSPGGIGYGMEHQ